jgi:hypothetical protein
MKCLNFATGGSGPSDALDEHNSRAQNFTIQNNENFELTLIIYLLKFDHLGFFFCYLRPRQCNNLQTSLLLSGSDVQKAQSFRLAGTDRSATADARWRAACIPSSCALRRVLPFSPPVTAAGRDDPPAARSITPGRPGGTCPIGLIADAVARRHHNAWHR